MQVGVMNAIEHSDFGDKRLNITTHNAKNITYGPNVNFINYNRDLLQPLNRRL